MKSLAGRAAITGLGATEFSKDSGRTELRMAAEAVKAALADAGLVPAAGVHYGWLTRFGLLTSARWVAMFARRYMHVYGATSEDFGKVAVADRRHAATNPAAWFYEQPITLEDHQQSRWIVEPLHLLDCCQESDGAVAIVVTSVER